MLGTSAWYAPGAAGAYVVESIIHNQKKMIPCSVYLEGEYGESDICIGVPAVIGRKGIEKIVKLDLTKEEAAKFEASAAAVRKTNQVLHEAFADNDSRSPVFRPGIFRERAFRRTFRRK